jgi:hypothetical protein
LLLQVEQAPELELGLEQVLVLGQELELGQVRVLERVLEQVLEQVLELHN